MSIPFFDYEYLHGLPPIEFEHLVSELLIAMGFNATTTQATSDGGIDVIAISEEPIIRGKYVIQCKRYANGNNIAESLVRELFGVMHSQNANKGILITTSDFTKAAISFAQDKAVELINGNLLTNLLNKYLAHSYEEDNFISDRVNENYLKHLQQVEREVEFLLKREEKRVEYNNKKKIMDSDEYFNLISPPGKYYNIKNFFESSFHYSVFGLYSNCTKEEWDSVKDDPDLKILLSFLDEYISKTLDAYREFNELIPPNNENVKDYYNSCVSQLKKIFVILKATDEMIKYFNPLLIKFLFDKINDYYEHH